MEKGWLPIGEAAKLLNVSLDTLRRWERKGIITSYRSPTGRRYYNLEQLQYVFAKKPTFPKDKQIYKEVSGSDLPKTAKTEKRLFNTQNLLILLSFLTTVYIILLIYFLLQPILAQSPLSPLP